MLLSSYLLHPLPPFSHPLTLRRKAERSTTPQEEEGKQHHPKREERSKGKPQAHLPLLLLLPKKGETASPKGAAERQHRSMERGGWGHPSFSGSRLGLGSLSFCFLIGVGFAFGVEGCPSPKREDNPDPKRDNDNDNDNDTLREVPHQSNEGLALQARVSGPWPL